MTRMALRAGIRSCHKPPGKHTGLTCEDTVPVAEKEWQQEQGAGGTLSPQTGIVALSSLSPFHSNMRMVPAIFRVGLPASVNLV